MSITMEKKGIVSSCADCISETHFCKLHQLRSIARYEIVYNEKYDRDPLSVTESEIDNWIKMEVIQ